MRRLLVVVLVALAGCAAPQEPAAEVVPAPADEGANVTAPVAREELPAFRETNRTEEGVGGEAHAHDYWRGETQVVLFDGPTDGVLRPFPRQDTSRVFETYAVLGTVPGQADRPALVYEGTGLVEFTVTKSPPWADSFRVSWRTAGSDWTEPGPVRLGEPVLVQPGPRETDTPHAVLSQWAWRIEAVGAVPLTRFPGNATDGTEPWARVVALKAAEPAVWPGHPDLYADGRPRTVLAAAAGRTSAGDAPGYTVFGPADEALVPEKLVATGTRTMDVFMNVTSLATTGPIESFTLQWRHAGTRPDFLGSFQRSNETDGKTWARWHFLVDETMVDSPYQPTSRWAFQAWANNEVGVGDRDLTWCWSCAPYTLEYTLTALAGPDPARP